MRPTVRFAGFAAITLLCGCGQKGPLVLPDAQKHTPHTQHASAPAAAPPSAPEPASAAPSAAPAPTTPPTP